MCQIRATKKKCGVKDLTPVKIHAVAKGELTAIPAPTIDVGTSKFKVIETDVTLDTGKFWVPIEGKNRSAKLTAEPVGEPEGNQYWNWILEIMYPEGDEEGMYNIDYLKGFQGHVVAQNGSGKKIFLGHDLENPIINEVLPSFDSEQGGWTIQLVLKMSETPPFYTGAVTTS